MKKHLFTICCFVLVFGVGWLCFSGVGARMTERWLEKEILYHLYENDNFEEEVDKLIQEYEMALYQE